VLSSVSRHRAGGRAAVPAVQVRGECSCGTCRSSQQARLGPLPSLSSISAVVLRQEGDLAQAETFYSPQKGPGNCTRPLPSASEAEILAVRAVPSRGGPHASDTSHSSPPHLFASCLDWVRFPVGEAPPRLRHQSLQSPASFCLLSWRPTGVPPESGGKFQDGSHWLGSHSAGEVLYNDQYNSYSTTPEWKPAFLRQAREFLFFPLLPREASEFPFSTEELGPSPRGSDPVSCRLT
jgi:hypothetical protein